MATAVKQFSFNTDVEGWAGYATANVVCSRSATEESGNDTNSGAGALQTQLAVKGKNQPGNYWYWAGTWEDLGVPAGAIVTAVDIDYDWRCSAYVYGTLTNRVGPCSLTAPTAHDFSVAQDSVSATTSWATVSGTAKTGLSEASDASVAFRAYVDLRTANTTGADVTMQFDWIVVTITYDSPNKNGTAAVVGIGETASAGAKAGAGTAAVESVGETAATGVPDFGGAEGHGGG